MQLTPWRKFDELFWDPFHFFETSPVLSTKSGELRFMPSSDVSETEKEIRIVLDVPGYDRKDVKVSIENGTLTIEGTMQEEKEDKHRTWYRRQAARGSFFQQMVLPKGVEEKHITCAMKNGKLTITVEKPEERPTGGRALPIDAE